MLIRPGGYNTGAQEYLEKGNKAGREFSRDELDHRMIIDGNLDLTRSIYESIPDHGQDRYLTFTLSFREDVVDKSVLRNVTKEFKQFLMNAYQPDEFNFYAEAHIPKMKFIPDKKTGEMIERKPHIHVIVPRINLLSGNEANPVDVYMNQVKYFEAFQEYINQKYNLESPREHVRADITDAASVLSRYKGDDFYGKNREFKQTLVRQVVERGITDRAGFYALVAESGETRIRNEDKDSEYIAVKLPGDAKFTNLKDTIFQDDFILRRELKKPPLDEKVIQQRLLAWPQRAKEIKYVNKATPSFRKRYSEALPDERTRLLAERETKFYQLHGEHHVVHPGQRPRDHQRSVAEAQERSSLGPPDSLQDLSRGDVANHGQAGSARDSHGPVLLPSDAYVHLGQHQSGGDSGLRPAVPTGGGRRASTVSTTAAGAGKGRGSRAAQSGAPGARTRVSDNPLPPHARNPRRMGTIKDIENRGRRLFDPLKPKPAAGPPLELDSAKLAGSAPGRRTGTKLHSGRKRRPGPTSSATRGQSRSSDHPRPPFARNPHHVPSIADIQRRGQRLFEPTRPQSKPLHIRLPSIKALTAGRSASTVAAYFSRQAEQQQLKPAQRHALRRLNKQYFDLRRAVFSDPRLTRQDKSQLVSVLAFERMKATDHIKYPTNTLEVPLMGSADIRKMIVEEKEDPGYSISAPRAAAAAGIRERVKLIVDRISKELDPATSEERARELAAKDIYTRKSKFSQNVHYLDKLTDKTLFVDTGKAIAMRRNGITEAGVAVALQLAKERFGSTLTINGTADFKRLVIEAAAKNGLDVHFTDKAMNESLVARRAELEIEKEGQAIAPADAEAAAPSPAQPEQTTNATEPGASALPVTVLAQVQLARFVDDKTRVARDLADSLGMTPQIDALFGEGKSSADIATVMAAPIGVTVAPAERVAFISQVGATLGVPERGPHDPADTAFKRWLDQRSQVTQAHGYDLRADSPSELVRREVTWRAGEMRLSDQDVRGSDTVMQMRGEEHAIWMLAVNDATPEGAAMLAAYMENDAYREGFKATIEKLYDQYRDSPESIEALASSTATAVELVNQVEQRIFSKQTPAAAPAQAAPVANRKVIHGELIAHGSAPYQHQADKQESYFVTLKTDAGERTVWGVGLAKAMQDAGLKAGDKVRLEDLGTMPVMVQEIAPDGSVSEKPTNRRVWAAEHQAPEREEVQAATPAAAPPTPAQTSPDDQGMHVD